jgi:ABC-2 type transport system permease protein
MKNSIAICRRELLSFFVSPIAYFVITGFALLAGYFFFNLLAIFNQMVMRYSAMAMYRGAQEMPNLNQWVLEPFYHTLLVVLVFLVPMLTMRTIAEERRRGTFELLATSPVSVTEIVIGKFLGVAAILTIMVALVCSFPALLAVFGQPGPELLPMLSGALAVLLCALAFASISIAVSAFTENQIVAAVSSMVVLLLLYVIHSPAEAAGGRVQILLEYLSPVLQAQDMIRGVVSTKTLIYFASLILVGVSLSQRALEAQRWR